MGSRGTLAPCAGQWAWWTAMLRARHRLTNSRQTRLFPTPASPTTLTTCPFDSSARARTPSSQASSSSRPTSLEKPSTLAASRRVRRGPIPRSAKTRTGVLTPFMAGVPWSLRVKNPSPSRAEERHDPVTRELVDRPLEAMDTFGQDLEEAVEEPMPFLRVEPLGEQQRVHHVGEEHGDLLPLPLERSAGDEDLLDEVSRRVGARLSRTLSRTAHREPLPAGVAEPLSHRVDGRAVRTGGTAREGCATLATEMSGLAVLVPAAGTPHGEAPAPLVVPS